jgi:PTS system glucose-specific IIA component
MRMQDVPDPVFAEALVGPGVAIDPGRVDHTIAVSPVAGTIVKLHPHAFVVQTSDGAGVLVHLGIDTVRLTGEGFSLLVAEGSEVGAGAGVIAWRPAEIEARGHSVVCPVVALDAAPSALSDVRESGEVVAGDPLFTWTH